MFGQNPMKVARQRRVLSEFITDSYSIASDKDAEEGAEKKVDFGNCVFGSTFITYNFSASKSIIINLGSEKKCTFEELENYKNEGYKIEATLKVAYANFIKEFLTKKYNLT
jgi:hypothetical protein